MSLYQKIKLTQKHKGHSPSSAIEPPDKSGADQDITASSRHEFTIKAVPTRQWAGAAAETAGASLVQIHVAAGSMASMLHTRSFPGASMSQAASTQRLPWQAAGGCGGPAKGQQAGGEAVTPRMLPGYRSMAQFGRPQELYKSSQSSVFQARCLACGKEVIIKRYTKGKMSSRAVHKMQREVRIMYRLRGQEGVVQILGDFEDGTYFYIAMEFYAGGDLYKRSLKQAKERPLEEHWICNKVIVPLLRVLCMLHDCHGVVHRDIKPENIFLTAGDELQLGDFGLAIQQQQELPFLRAGTLDYMAPEVLLNPLANHMDESCHYTAVDLRRIGFVPYDEKVDVWAVGVLVYELMSSGATPFFHNDPDQTQKNIIRCDLAALHFERHQLLSPWADFVRTALHREPPQRPTAAQLLQHRWVQQHLPNLPRPPLVPQRWHLMSRAVSLSALCLFKGSASPADTPPLDPAAKLVHASSVASAMAAKLLASSRGDSGGSFGTSVLQATPSSGTCSSDRGGGSTSIASFASLRSLAETAAAASSAAAGVPPPPPIGSTDLAAVASITSCLTLTVQPGCQCSTCRLVEDSCRLEGFGSDRGAMEDSEMLPAAAELPAADPSSFAAPSAQQWQPAGPLGEPALAQAAAIVSTTGPLGCLPPSPFAAHSSAPGVLSLPSLVSMETEPTVAPPLLPSPLGQPRQAHFAQAQLGQAGPMPGRTSSLPSTAHAVTPQAPAEAEGAVCNGDVRLAKAGQHNRIITYMQKQHSSLLHTLHISRSSPSGNTSGCDARAAVAVVTAPAATAAPAARMAACCRQPPAGRGSDAFWPPAR